MVDLIELTDLLVRKGKVRGNPVGMNLFRDEIPAAYQGRRVDPCAIVRHAMNDGERVYVDAEYHDCIAGSYNAGFTEATPLVNSGAYLAENIPAFTDDQGGRMANRIRPEEMFVIVPMQFADGLPGILAEIPNVEGLLDATKREDSDYWEKKVARGKRIPVAAARTDPTPDPAAFPTDLPWDAEATAVMAAAPADIRSFAVGRAEDYARERGRDLVTRDLLAEQMAELGMDLDDMTSGGDPGVDPAAPVYASESSTIDADPAIVWALLCDISSWPDWQPDVERASIDGPVAAGTSFSWKTGPGSISSQLERVDPERVMAFSGSGMGAKIRHVFHLEPAQGSTRLTVTQSMEGLAVRGMRRMLLRITATSMATWLTAVDEQLASTD